MRYYEHILSKLQLVHGLYIMNSLVKHFIQGLLEIWESCLLH